MSEFGPRDGGWPEDFNAKTDPEFLESEFTGDGRTVTFDEDAYGGTAYPEIHHDDPRTNGLEGYTDMGGWA